MGPRKYRETDHVDGERILPEGAAAYDRSLDLPALKTKRQNKKLKSHLATIEKAHKASTLASYEHDHYLLPSDNAGLLQTESNVERTWRVSQDEIKQSIGVSAASKGFELSLTEFGPYAVDYTANGRHLAVAGRKGHVATFDWQTGRLHSELNLNETVRDICWLHDQSFYAVAQKKYVYIYDKSGLEIHQLKNHIEVNRMQFLRYHFLLATIGKPGYLKYQDTSTGSVVCEHRTKLGSCDVMTQNPHTAIINLGHANGTVTLWSPNSSTPHAKLLAHRGALTAVAVDSSHQGYYMATSGMDSTVKVWDMRTWNKVNEWQLHRPAKSLSFSQKGLLAAGWGNHVSVYQDVMGSQGKRVGPYMTNLFPSQPVHDVQFCPFEDVLGVGHSKGFASLLIPGAGEANYDSMEADPFETRNARREREVHSLLDKIQPDQITMDRNAIGKLARPVRTGQLGEASAKPKEKGIGPRQDVIPFSKMSRTERLRVTNDGEEDDVVQDSFGEDEGVEQRGKKVLRRKRVVGKNKVRRRNMRTKADVIDAKTMAVRQRIAEKQQRAKEQRDAASSEGQPTGALARFAQRARP